MHDWRVAVMTRFGPLQVVRLLKTHADAASTQTIVMAQTRLWVLTCRSWCPLGCTSRRTGPQGPSCTASREPVIDCKQHHELLRKNVNTFQMDADGMTDGRIAALCGTGRRLVLRSVVPQSGGSCCAKVLPSSKLAVFWSGKRARTGFCKAESSGPTIGTRPHVRTPKHARVFW